jgi:2-methylcitrate dehydratase PrpD
MEDKIELAVDPECAAKFPLHRSAKVEIEMNDGTIYQHHQLTRHGDPDEPLSDQELVDKFHELAEPRVGLQIAQTLSGGVLGGQGLSVRDLAKLWSKMSY